MRPKTTPMTHQVTATEVQRNFPAFANFLEQGLGKTKVDLDNTAEFFLNGVINRLLVVAPNGVHLAWENQIETHLSDEVPRKVFTWRGGLSRKEAIALDFSLKDPNHLTIFMMNVEALSTSEAAKAMVNSFIGPQTKFTIDESTRIKHHQSARTKFIIKAGRKCKIRRILTGTPVTQTPFDLYSQFLFLDPKILGFSSYHSFANRYAEYRTEVATKKNKSWQYKKLCQYRRLKELSGLISPYSVRFRKEDCLDLPDKIYKVIPIQLTKEQRKFYNEVDRDGIADFDSFEVLAPERLTRLTKMQQIISGFIYDEERATHRIPGKNPKLETLLDLVEDYPGKMIIIARFRHEIELIVQALETLGGGEILQLHGGVKSSLRKENEERFQTDPTIRFYVGQEKAMIGWTLTAAETVVYFSNEFSYEARYQSEDRAHRIGLTHPVNYIDLVAENTVDERVIAILEGCRTTAEVVVDKKPSPVAVPKLINIEEFLPETKRPWTVGDQRTSEILFEEVWSDLDTAVDLLGE